MKRKKKGGSRTTRGVRARGVRGVIHGVTVTNLEHRVKQQLNLAIGRLGPKEHGEETLDHSYAFIASVLEHLPSMVFVKDAKDLRFVHLNKAAEELLGYSRGELLGKNDYDVFPENEADFFTAKDREVLSSGCILDIPEEWIQTRNKGRRVLNTKKIPICDLNGAPQYLLGISHDITERKEAEEQLRKGKDELERQIMKRTGELVKANAALQEEIALRKTAAQKLQELSGELIHAQEEERSRIARDIHDDFSQQLAIIGIELEKMRQAPLSSAEQMSAQCSDLWQKVKQLSTDLHSLSRELHPSKLDHLGLVAAVRSLCTEIAQRHDVTIKCEGYKVPSWLPRTVALCLYRVAQEALHNIVKHSGVRQAEVEISGRPGLISMYVCDSGKGFDPKLLAGNKGLGLVSIQERARGIGGQVSIQSAPSQGTCITIRVPLPASTSA
jgi:PAS domain S-box-containing protein